MFSEPVDDQLCKIHEIYWNGINIDSNDPEMLIYSSRHLNASFSSLRRSLLNKTILNIDVNCKTLSTTGAEAYKTTMVPLKCWTL